MNGRYRGLEPDGSEICEHVTFHAELRARQQRIFINPRMINAAYTDHTLHLLFRRRLLRRATQMVKPVYRTLFKARRA